MAYSYDDVITLIKQTPTGALDEYGQEVFTETTREVFCKVTSTTRAEFYQARQTGLEPEFVFVTQPCNYDNERILAYGVDEHNQPQRYSIYRTYRRGADVLEIYAQKEVGRL